MCRVIFECRPSMDATVLRTANHHAQEAPLQQDYSLAAAAQRGQGRLGSSSPASLLLTSGALRCHRMPPRLGGA